MVRRPFCDKRLETVRDEVSRGREIGIVLSQNFFQKNLWKRVDGEKAECLLGNLSPKKEAVL